MSEKYLPIKIFEKRKDYDDRSTEGGGDSHEGSWVLHGEELNKRVDYLSKNVNTIQDSFQKWKENKRALPMIISTTVIDKAIAKTHRGRIVNLLENDGKDNVIGVYGDRQLLSMVTEESLLSTISQVIGRREDEATLISSISGIDVFSPFVEPYDSDNNVYRVRLCDYNDFDLNNMAKILFEQSCEAAGIKIHSKVRFTTDMTIYRVTIDNLEQLNAMGEFESVYSAEKTYPIMATMDILDSDNVVVVKQPEETEEYPVVALPKDTEGIEINNIYDMRPEVRMQNIHIGVFPMNDYSIVYAFYHRRDRLYRRLHHQMNCMSLAKKLELINYWIFKYTENYYISPEIQIVIDKDDKLKELSRENNGMPNLGYVTTMVSA